MAEWIYGMVAVSLFGMVVMQMTPEGAYQRYVRLCLGGVFLLAACSPVLSFLTFLGRDDVSLTQQVVASWWKNGGWPAGAGAFGDGNVDQELHAWEKTMEQQIQRKQERWMEESLAILAEDYGFVCLKYQVQWQGDRPSQLTLWVAGRQEETEEAGMSTIEPVRMDPVLVEYREQEGIDREKNGQGTGQETEQKTGQQTSQEIEYEPSELRPLRQAIQQVWQLEEDQIRIDWEGKW